MGNVMSRWHIITRQAEKLVFMTDMKKLVSFLVADKKVVSIDQFIYFAP